MKKLLILVSVLTILTAVFACLHRIRLGHNDADMVRLNGILTDIGSLPFEPVTGMLINGKGQETRIDAPGVSLARLFDSDITVTAADSYKVEVSAGELDKAFLILDRDRLRLVVFGDADAKRNVKNVTEVREA